MAAADGQYLAGKCVSDEQIGSWVDQFNTQGYLFLEDVLPPEWCALLREDLETAFENREQDLSSSSSGYDLMPRMFESSEANVRLFDLEPIVSLAEALVRAGLSRHPQQFVAHLYRRWTDNVASGRSASLYRDRWHAPRECPSSRSVLYGELLPDRCGRARARGN